MSPELFYPENFGLTDSHPTKHSDCYALGMVMYEVLSGRVPFPCHNICAVVAKISKGERPGRPRGAGGKWFTDDVWGVVQRCWAPRRDHRPKIGDVLQCLEEASRFWIPLSPGKVAVPSTTNPRGTLLSRLPRTVRKTVEDFRPLARLRLNFPRFHACSVELPGPPSAGPPTTA